MTYFLYRRIHRSTGSRRLSVNVGERKDGMLNESGTPGSIVTENIHNGKSFRLPVGQCVLSYSVAALKTISIVPLLWINAPVNQCANRLHNSTASFLFCPAIYIHGHVNRLMPRQLLRRLYVRGDVDDEIDVGSS